MLTSIDARREGVAHYIIDTVLDPLPPLPPAHSALLPPLSCDQTLAVVTSLTPGELGGDLHTSHGAHIQDHLGSGSMLCSRKW